MASFPQQQQQEDSDFPQLTSQLDQQSFNNNKPKKQLRKIEHKDKEETSNANIQSTATISNNREYYTNGIREVNNPISNNQESSEQQQRVPYNNNNRNNRDNRSNNYNNNNYSNNYSKRDNQNYNNNKFMNKKSEFPEDNTVTKDNDNFQDNREKQYNYNINSKRDNFNTNPNDIQSNVYENKQSNNFNANMNEREYPKKNYNNNWGNNRDNNQTNANTSNYNRQNRDRNNNNYVEQDKKRNTFQEKTDILPSKEDQSTNEKDQLITNQPSTATNTQNIERIEEDQFTNNEQNERRQKPFNQKRNNQYNNYERKEYNNNNNNNERREYNNNNNNSYNNNERREYNNNYNNNERREYNNNNNNSYERKEYNNNNNNYNERREYNNNNNSYERKDYNNNQNERREFDNNNPNNNLNERREHNNKNNNRNNNNNKYNNINNYQFQYQDNNNNGSQDKEEQQNNFNKSDNINNDEYPINNERDRREDNNAYRNQQNRQNKQKVVFVEKEGPRKFQFFNSKSKAQGEDSTQTNSQQNENLQELVENEGESKKTVPEAAKIKKELLKKSYDENLEIPHKTILRGKEGIFDTNCFATSMENEEKLLNGPSNFMRLSKDEKYLVATCDTIVKVIRLSDNEVISSREFISICHTHLSNCNKFIQVFDRVDNNKYSAGLFTFPEFNLIREFNEKRYIKENAPYIKFNSEETKAFYYNYSTGFVEIYSISNLFDSIHKAEMQNIDFFQISPKHEFIVGCFLEHMIGYEKTQAKLQFYNLEKDKREKVKNVDKAQEIFLKWSPDGTNVIIITQTIHDTTGNSYYGQTAIWLYSFGVKKLLKLPTIDGPVHDIAWNPMGDTFIAILGYMPAKPILYTLKGVPVFSFGSMHKNTIRFQPQGQLVLFGGFGNISGDVDIWELNNLEKLAKFNANSSGSIEWSLDGKQILAGVLFPRLRVDNNFKVFKWNGELINTCSFNHTELYEVAWKSNQIYLDKSHISQSEIAQALEKQRNTTKQEQNAKAPKFGGGNFAALLRNDRGDEGPRNITGNEEWILKAKNEAKQAKHENYE